ncbi:MAG TPA: DUF1743 domain-containing protein [Methanothermococcus okinawensis]|uniref:DUF1743 domain-containing protein n=1 Tax=Methanothermococcus okinawensis TaxID=155863 RepID=A0A833DZX7_9EURY|nr:DUF1743 domain-containing protein [Methanothermococcus okinawensis]HIP91603.1 DUF1743 domain-containing protein [Methanothermococcus okinawensis]
MEGISYRRIVAMVDEGLGIVELVEEHPCPNGSQWVIYQYKRTSPLVISAWREGNKHHFILRIGRCRLNLIPSISAAGIEEVSIKGDKVHIHYAGLAGGGVGIELRRGAENVIDTVILERGGGSKLGRGVVITPKMEKVIVGIDDTDTKEEGATWVLAHEIGRYLESKGFGYYMDHTIVQLYPGNPYKTQNCVSVALTFAVYPSYKYKIREVIKDYLRERSLSDKTAIALYYGITPSKSMKIFTNKAKEGMVSLEEAIGVAEKNNIEVVKIFDRDEGIIGAVAALGLAEHHDIAARLGGDID